MLSPRNSLTVSAVVPDTRYWEDVAIIENYFAKVKQSSAAEGADLEKRGIVAMEAAKRTKRYSDLSKIYVHLTSAAFHQEKYSEVIEYVDLCHESRFFFVEKTLLISCYCLKSTACIKLAEKESSSNQQIFFQMAQATAQEALILIEKDQISDSILQGNILFNLGTIEEAISQGDLDKAIKFYQQARELFKKAKAEKEYTNTKSRLIQIQFKKLKANDSEKQNLSEFSNITSIPSIKPQI